MLNEGDVGKFVKVWLKNGHHFSGKILGIDSRFLKMDDRYCGTKLLALDSILDLQFKEHKEQDLVVEYAKLLNVDLSKKQKEQVRDFLQDIQSEAQLALFPIKKSFQKLGTPKDLKSFIGRSQEYSQEILKKTNDFLNENESAKKIKNTHGREKEVAE
jgi:hypothetical protein